MLAQGGGAVKNYVNLQQRYNNVTTSCKLAFIYIVTSSNGRIPDLDSGDSSSNLLAIASFQHKQGEKDLWWHLIDMILAEMKNNF